VSTAESETNNEFFGEFLDDYFAECDEHLTLVRRGLLALEPFLNRPRVDRALLDELFRSFHSLKGISAMVGVRGAEHLAHHMESYLRRLRDQETALTAQGLDGLIAGTKMLEHVVAARRSEAPAPDIAPVLAQLETLTASAAPRDALAAADAPPPAPLPDPGSETAAAAKKVWRVEFAPAPELAARGVNVNTIRTRLQEIGEQIGRASCRERV